MKTNRKTSTPKEANAHGVMMPKVSAEEKLERIVSCLMLFEDTFYSTGSEIAKDIKTLLKNCSIPFVCDLAVKTRHLGKLRHAPLYLMVQALRMEGTPEERNLIGDAISQVISRADELSEIIAIYQKENGNDAPFPRQLKAGVAKAFPKFNEYNLAKYNREGSVTLRDAMFISHPKPENKDMKKLWEKLINNKLKTPETWEVMLSAGKDKKKTFEKLLSEKKLGYMALLKNLRNMDSAGVKTELIVEALIKGAKESKALPFRFVTAERHAPAYKKALNEALLMSMEEHEKLVGTTAALIDVSGSMIAALSDKSEVNRIEAAATLAALVKEVSKTKVYIFNNDAKPCSGARGLNLIEEVMGRVGGGTKIGQSIKTVLADNPNLDRIIIITDEQSSDSIPNLPKGMKGYIVNVAPNKVGLPTYDGVYTRFSGFSENVISWIIGEEKR